MEIGTAERLTAAASYDLLRRLTEKGVISKETALEFSLEKVEMDQMLRGIYRNSSLEQDY